MGDTIRVVGGLTITPELTWKEMRGNPALPSDFADRIRIPYYGKRFREMDIVLVVHHADNETDEGTLTVKTSSEVVPSDYSGRYLETDVQTLLDEFPDHEFRGYFECHSRDHGTTWRVVIHNRRAIRVEPTITWVLPD